MAVGEHRRSYKNNAKKFGIAILQALKKIREQKP